MIIKKNLLLVKFSMILAEFSMVFSSCSVTEKVTKEKVCSQSAIVTPIAIKNDSTRVKDTAKNAIKPYKDIITNRAITDKGLFTVHKVGEKYYFEIQDSILNKDILIISRIRKGAAGHRPFGGNFGYSGDQINEKVIQFTKGPNNKLFMNSVSYIERSRDSSVNGMYRSVFNSNMQSIISSFEIKTISPDSVAVVIDVTDYIAGDNDVFFFKANQKKSLFGLDGLQGDKSYIKEILSFPSNVEIHTVKTYSAVGMPVTYELNTSLVLLPTILMQPRYADARIGYFTVDYLDFDVPQGVKESNVITRWRLEPKPEDIDKYRRGELVDPKKPIIFYIDPVTPKKWIPYLIQGVNDWQKAFEKAGFKNAIYALEAPMDDSEWSMEDARHNVIVYKPSVIANASGPHVHDPRTGEILETHVNWYHNVMELLRNWYMIQAGPNDPRARKLEFDDSLMGQLIRFVSSHEIGHTLGLRHNFGASSTIPVEKLRDKKWVEENGFCPSIMDYARFNYVAQPEDHISEKGILPRIGIYDQWAIEWGYKWLPHLKTYKDEKEYMNKWVISKLEKDKRLWFGDESGYFDPRRQAEAVGDDAIKASEYGIENLKRVMPKLIEWTKEPNEDYTALNEMNAQVIQQYKRYLSHVALYVGGRMNTKKTVEQYGSTVEYVNSDDQRRAVQFFHKQLFETPNWIMNKDLAALESNDGFVLPYVIQVSILERITSHAILHNLLWFETTFPDKAYTVNQLLTDLETGIWKELTNKTSVDLYRRNLQKIYTERLINIYLLKVEFKFDLNAAFSMNTDIYSIVKYHMKKLIDQITSALPFYKNDISSKMHFEDIKQRLQSFLDPQKQRFIKNNLVSNPTKEKKGFRLQSIEDEYKLVEDKKKGCWDNNIE